MKGFSQGILITVIAILCLLLTGEIAIRAYVYLMSVTDQYGGRSIELSEEYGWLPTKNHQFSVEKIDAAGTRYMVDFKTDSNGFRIYGDPEAKDRKKVLFLGDSFTQAVDVSNSKTYYGILADNMPIEVFSIGGGGYGTLQEYMQLDKYVDEIRPDIVVIQFSSNDFINNSYELEAASNRNNNGMRRPYLTEHGVVYRNPGKLPVVRDFANKYSRFMYFIIKRIDRLYARGSTSVEDVIAERGVGHPLFRESVAITEQLLERIRARVPSTARIYAFSVDGKRPFYEEFRRISESNGIQFIDGIPQALDDAEKNEITTKAADRAHWNEAGHEIAAKVLKKHLDSNYEL